MADDLASQIAQSIDRWRDDHPDVTVMEILSALEDVRHKLTEVFLKHG